jgi:hypothetical protein
LGRTPFLPAEGRTVGHFTRAELVTFAEQRLAELSDLATGFALALAAGGERYCPDCTRFEVLELARQADDEARVLRQFQPQSDQTGEGPAGDALPF